jgi:Fur family transcriptional regulator, peroxide stress response regulator
VSGAVSDLDRHFQRVGLRVTPQRYDVLEFLVRNPIHATADEIFEALNRRDPRVSRATVYNSLRDLARTGLVRQVPGEGKAARFDAYLQPHHHFVCDQCGEVEDIDWFDIPVSSWKSAVGTRKVREHEVVFHGVCASCANSPVRSN